MTFPDFYSLPGAIVFHIQPDVEHWVTWLACMIKLGQEFDESNPYIKQLVDKWLTVQTNRLWAFWQASWFIGQNPFYSLGKNLMKFLSSPYMKFGKIG